MVDVSIAVVAEIITPVVAEIATAADVLTETAAEIAAITLHPAVVDAFRITVASTSTPLQDLMPMTP